MSIGRRIALTVSVALVSATATLVPVAPARAGCSLDDLINAVANTVGDVTSGSCAAACATGAGCGAAVAVTAVLAGVSADASQGSVNTFCSDVNNLIQQVNNGSDDANSVVNALQQATGSSIGQDLLSELSSAVGAVADPLGIAQCACNVEQGLGQLGSDFGACLQDFLCAGDALLGSPCTCTPPPPIVADCQQSNVSCGEWNDADSACEGGVGNVPTILAGPNGQTIPPYTPVTVSKSSAGTLVTGGGSGSNGSGMCAPVYYCFCPAPMVPTWTFDYPYAINNGFQSVGPQFYIFSCDCPSGTSPAPNQVSGVSSCICNNSGQPANFSPDSFTGMCPPPACPSGQVRLSPTSACVTPCSNPSDGMTMDGSCCNPAQMTSCGTCCPPGTTPDPTNGTCIPPQVIQ
jgi:hypothetical protein